jgi:hypothetical protein
MIHLGQRRAAGEPLGIDGSDVITCRIRDVITGAPRLTSP